MCKQEILVVYSDSCVFAKTARKETSLSQQYSLFLCPSDFLSKRLSKVVQQAGLLC